MVIEYTKSDMESMKQMALSEITGLKDYLSMLGNVLADAERDITDTRVKAKIFISIGQAENHGYLMERIEETNQRIEIIRKCMEECKASIEHKEARIKYYDGILNTPNKA